MKKKQDSQEKFKTMIGGQALIEGILMRGPYKQAIVVRSPDGLVEKVEELKINKDRSTLARIPFVRGVLTFFSSMYNGVTALMFSADYFPDEEEEKTEPSKLDLWLEKKLGNEKFQQALIYFALFLGLAFMIGLFFLLPGLISELCLFWIKNQLALNLCEGLVRIAIFLIYLILVSKMKDIRRVFAYHGAEHKTIRCYEAKLPLTVENVRPMSRLHPRCGTSFLFVVMIISILVFSAVTIGLNIRYPVLRILVKLLLLPVVVGISYEINRFVGRHNNWFTRAISFPGMWLQNFTTNEPDDSMIEVAIRALELVIPETEGADEW